MPEKQPYDKPALTIDEQIDLLIKRGLSVPDRERAAHYLRYISYYRLSIYARILQVPDSTEHQFQDGTTFDDILKLYTFDRELRLLVMDAIERIEVALRSTIAYEFSIGAGPSWYADASLFKESKYFNHATEMARIEKLCNKSHEVFMKHHRETYDSLPPSWKLVEAMTVGEIERIFFNMNADNRTVKDARYRIAKSLGIPVRLLLSWFKPICLLRNICAHHGRLWNRKLIYRFDIPRNPNIPWVSHDVGDRQKVYAYLCMVEVLMKCINPHSSWSKRLIELLDNHPDIPTQYMVFPEGWCDDEFWGVK